MFPSAQPLKYNAQRDVINPTMSLSAGAYQRVELTRQWGFGQNRSQLIAADQALALSFILPESLEFSLRKCQTTHLSLALLLYCKVPVAGQLVGRKSLV